jgi:hypothetical protein
MQGRPTPPSVREAHALRSASGLIPYLQFLFDAFNHTAQSKQNINNILLIDGTILS